MDINMAEEKNTDYVPSLTLGPTSAEAPSAPMMAITELQIAEAEQAAAALDINQLSEAEQLAVGSFQAR